MGPTAALATIEKFLANDVQRVNCARGKRVRSGWLAAAAAAGIKISVSGLECWPAFSWQGLRGGVHLQIRFVHCFISLLDTKNTRFEQFRAYCRRRGGRKARVFLDSQSSFLSPLH